MVAHGRLLHGALGWLVVRQPISVFLEKSVAGVAGQPMSPAHVGFRA
jgi:hypothetical protein